MINPGYAAEGTAFHVGRTTTDKLQEYLNGFDTGMNVVQITHTGGRDWVVIATWLVDSIDERDEFQVDNKTS